jgi:hypothetical protein
MGLSRWQLQTSRTKPPQQTRHCDANARGARVPYCNRRTSENAPVTDATVIVFAKERAKWSEGARFVRSARPDQQGGWQIKGLPPGAYPVLATLFVYGLPGF